jgi:hypothetical protein
LRGPSLELLLGGPSWLEGGKWVLGDSIQPPRVGLLIHVQEGDHGGREDIVFPEPFPGRASFKVTELGTIVVDEIRFRLRQGKGFRHFGLLLVKR